MIYVTGYNVKLYFDNNLYHLQCKQEQNKSSDVESIPHYIGHNVKVRKSTANNAKVKSVKLWANSVRDVLTGVALIKLIL